MRLFNNLCRTFHPIAFAMVLLLAWQVSHAGPLRDWIAERRLAEQAAEIEGDRDFAPLSLPGGVRVLSDVAYGLDDKQRMDIYLPPTAIEAPVILMVHGGAWRLGDKSAQAVVENKVARWVSRGFIFISVNYRLLPGTAPAEQAQDVARALAAAQGRAASWGADPAKFILMGHSAGAHLVALLGASPGMAMQLGAKPWLGTVLLDSAALDVVQIMEARHARFYARAFGSDPAYWRAVSPFHVLTDNATPILAVCSTRRDDACPQARAFAAAVVAHQARAAVLEQDLSHKDINQQLGASGDYTDAVESFMGGLDEAVMRALKNQSAVLR